MSKYLNPKADLTFKKVFGEHKNLVIAPELLANSEIAEALEIVERAAYTPAELEAYNKYWLDISPERTALAQSHAEGKEEGKTEHAISVAKKMKADSMPIDLIIKYSGLAKEKIEKL